MDIEPILHLMELAKAERIPEFVPISGQGGTDRQPHPDVRRARLRLLAAAPCEHLQRKKPLLAEEKLAEMAALPQSQQGGRPAFLEALRYLTCMVRGASDQAAAHRAEVERALGSRAAAALLILGVAQASKQGALERLPPAGDARQNGTRRAAGSRGPRG